MLFFPSTFNFYVFTSFFKWLVAMVFGLSFVIFLVDLVELLKKTQKVEMSFLDAAFMSLLRVPELLMEILPILVLFAVIGVLWWRSRSHELVVARATGLSLWQFLKPIMVTVLFFGTFVAAVFNPLALKSSQQLKIQEAKYFWVDNTEPVLKTSTTGTWMKEDFGNSSYRLVRARKVTQTSDQATLENVDVFRVKDSSTLIFSWHADTLVLAHGQMELLNVIDQTDPDVPKKIENQILSTKLSSEDLFQAKPNLDDVDFWNMAERAKELRLSGDRYKETELKYVKLLVLPFTLVSMVLLAAVFSLRMTRSGGVGQMILAGVSIALLLHFLTDILYSLALVGSLPILLSVIIVPLGLSSVCAFFLLEHEDG